jgi:ATP-binding cassette subfamily B protein
MSAPGDAAAGSEDAVLRPRELAGEAVRLIRRFAAQQRTSATIAIVGAISYSATLVASAAVVRRITDDLVVPALGDGTATLAPAGAVGLLMGVALWKAASILTRRAAAMWWQFRSEQQLRRDIVAHQLGLSLRWYASRGVGDLLSVSGTDTKQATRMLAPLPFALGVVFLLAGSMALIVSIDLALGLLSGAMLVAVVVVDSVGSWFAFRRMELVQSRRGTVATVAHESFDGAVSVRALGRERDEVARLGRASAGLRDAIVALGRNWTGFRAVTDLAPALATIGILTLGVVRAAEGDLGVGDLTAVTYLLSLLVMPTRLVGFLIWDAAGSVAGWRRVERVLGVTDRVVHGTRRLPAAAGSGAAVRLDGVRFAYAPDRPVLAGVDLALAPGRTVAVVGPTGSGKSTLARLLARLWDPDEGRVLLDGVDLRELAPGEIPASVAYVPQEPFLFDDTIAGNIDLGDPDVTAAAIGRAVALARLDDVVAALPDGLATRIGERGATLSGGQQQRVGLARALARAPRLLVLDDATSAIDATVEAEILAGLRRAGLGATVVLVAARPSTIALADEVVHLVAGRVADRGTHTELLARSPAYAQLVEAYARDAATRRSTPRGGALPVEPDPTDPEARATAPSGTGS